MHISGLNERKLSKTQSNMLFPIRLKRRRTPLAIVEVVEALESIKLEPQESKDGNKTK